MAMFKKSPPTDVVVVPDRVIRRARQVPAGSEVSWIEGTLSEIGRSAFHHRPGDHMLDEAISGAEAVLALLHEMRRREA